MRLSTSGRKGTFDLPEIVSEKKMERALILVSEVVVTEPVMEPTSIFSWEVVAVEQRMKLSVLV